MRIELGDYAYIALWKGAFQMSKKRRREPQKKALLQGEFEDYVFFMPVEKLKEMALNNAKFSPHLHLFCYRHSVHEAGYTFVSMVFVLKNIEKIKEYEE